MRLLSMFQTFHYQSIGISVLGPDDRRARLEHQLLNLVVDMAVEGPAVYHRRMPELVKEWSDIFLQKGVHPSLETLNESLSFNMGHVDEAFGNAKVGAEERISPHVNSIKLEYESLRRFTKQVDFVGEVEKEKSPTSVEDVLSRVFNQTKLITGV